ncbi:hypothetical protein SAMN02745127_00199 [Oceanospirillum multiglobuliferum]|uniref:Z-ring associated protein G n=1 Tax=Oceanospirillum multiglobuliferum TaxID=64969 RepID=A0A1T4KSN7_9GAMM|nr:DUF1043 family protein [Oceanospirillum multiglobuliferum]OPX56131.1 hypothetical protein BTE48_06205 [Oceanospirillum multiglobuliferum]SJZ45348.1 hypothetical protein SAMN02745127_00199 [Oceanospirillum multiglobuliferum]
MDTNIDWVLMILTFTLGCGAGALLYHLIKANTGQSADLKQRMNQKEMELARLTESVGEHFARTDELASVLEKNYQSLLSHLQKGADSFCDDATLYKQIGHKKGRNKATFTESAEEENYASEPPRDYAPKSSGTLSEKFGLDPEVTPQPPKGL